MHYSCGFYTEDLNPCLQLSLPLRVYARLYIVIAHYKVLAKDELYSFFTPLSPNNDWVGLKPGGLDRSLCPGERARERERESPSLYSSSYSLRL